MSLVAEQVCVANAIESPAAFEIISEIISSADFTHEDLRCVWDMVVAYREAGRVLDLPIVAAVLEKSNRWKSLRVKTEPLYYIGAILECSVPYQNVHAYAGILKNASMNRHLIEYADSVKNLAYDGDIEADQKLGDVHAMLEPLAAKQPSRFITSKESAQLACIDIQAIMNSGGGMSGIPTGYEDIDELIGGLQDSSLYIVGARPSMGKTLFMMGIADYVAKSNPVIVFSLEMPAKDLSKRSIAKFGSINLDDLMRGNLDEQSQSKLFTAGLEVKKLDMRIDDTASLTIDQLVTRTRIAARKSKPRLVVVDYLTLIKGKGDNKHLEVGDIAVRLKGLAKEMECPVLVLAQLNRGLESRTDKRPQLSDLRESGGIEEAADVIMFLYRDEVYNEDSERKGVLEVHTAKNRNGKIGTRYLKSELEYARFVRITSAIPEITRKEKNDKPLSRIMGSAAANGSGGY